MHEFDASAMETQRTSRKGKERDLGGGEPQPTDIADKIIAMRRRAAGNTKPRERAERPTAAPPPSTPRADRSPAQRILSSPRKANAPTQGTASRVAPEADPDEFSRRLKITSSPSPRMAQSTPKLYDPERDPIPVMRRTAEPEQMADTSRGAQRDAAPMRQLFNHRKDDPVRFSVMARPQQAGGRATPAPKNSADYSSTSAASSYAASQTSSSFTLSSTTDGSSASSALFEGQKKSTEEGSNLAIQLKRLYRNITHLESKVNEADQNEEAEDTSRARIKPKGPDSEEVEIEKWKKRLESHKSLIETIHTFLEISLAPSVPASLRNIPTKYNIIIRLWTYGFYKLLEALRRASRSSPLALGILQDFIYYAYSFYTFLLEEPALSSFRSGWLEALGDIARYKMAISALVIDSPPSHPLTSHNISQALTVNGDTSNQLLKPPTTAAGEKSISDERAARIDDSPSPSVGVVAARAMEIEPDSERWRNIARDWYGAGLTDQPGTGKLHHHLGLLSRDTESEELRAVYHFVKSMTTLHPFQTSRESILPIWSQPNQARRSLPDANVSDLFVLLHGMLFTNVDLDAFQPTLSRFVERLEIEGAEDRDWIMMAVVNIGSILEYGKPSGVLKRLGGVGSRDSGAAAAMRVMAKREAMADESMDVDATLSPATSPPTADELPLQLRLAMQLAFGMFSYVLQRPTRKPSPFARSTINPYLTVLLTFLSTILKHAGSREILERSIPWDALAAFFTTVPRTVMSSQHLDQVMPADTRRWDMITSGCAPPLPEDWCLRGMEWVGRKVFERGYWRSGLEKKVEQEVLNDAEEEDMTDGHIEDDDDEEGEQSSYGKRWVRIVRCAVEVSGAVDGLEWTQGTREWRVEGTLAQKVAVWKEQARVENEEEERRRGGTRWGDDSMDVDDEGILGASEESDEDSENDSPEIRALKERRRYLESLVQDSQRTPTATAPSRRPKRTPTNDTRPLLSIQPGYTVLVVDTNILLSSLPMFASLVESIRWTVIIPLPVVMELDGISHNIGQLGQAAKDAMAYLTSHVRSHSTSLKIQTSKGNYLQNLNIRTEEISFSGSPERSMDDLILKAAIWHQEHWMDRSAFLQANAMALEKPVKVVLLSLDRNLRLKARARDLAAASEKDLACILTVP